MLSVGISVSTCSDSSFFSGNSMESTMEAIPLRAVSFSDVKVGASQSSSFSAGTIGADIGEMETILSSKPTKRFFMAFQHVSYIY